jgi:hypothetical protein
MSYLHCVSELTINEDNSATYTLNMCNVCFKSMQSVTPDPKVWIENAVHNRSRIEGDRIYKIELERHLEAGTMPANPTKESLILAYEIPVRETSDIT